MKLFYPRKLPHFLFIAIFMALSTHASAEDTERDVRTAAFEDHAILLERDLPCNGSIATGEELYSPLQCNARGIMAFAYIKEPYPISLPSGFEEEANWSQPSFAVRQLSETRQRILAVLSQSTNYRQVLCLQVAPQKDALAIQETYCWLKFRNSRNDTRTIFIDFQDIGRWSMGGSQPLDEQEFRVFIENFVYGINALI